MHQHLRPIRERKRARVEDEEQQEQEARVPRDLADPRRKRIRVRRSSAVSMRFRGVCWDKRGKKWRVRITVDGKVKHIGRFIDKIEAAHAYDAYAIANGIDVPRNFRGGAGRFFDQESQRWLAVKVTVGGKRDLSSRFRGVSWNNTTRQHWMARITIDGKTIGLGLFAEEENAARAYDKHVIDHNLDCTLNFPDGPEKQKGIGAFTDEVDEANDAIVNDIDTVSADFEVALLLNLFNGDAESSPFADAIRNTVADMPAMSAAAVEAEAAASAAPLWRMCEHDGGFHRYAHFYEWSYGLQCYICLLCTRCRCCSLCSDVHARRVAEAEAHRIAEAAAHRFAEAAARRGVAEAAAAQPSNVEPPSVREEVALPQPSDVAVAVAEVERHTLGEKESSLRDAVALPQPSDVVVAVAEVEPHAHGEKRKASDEGAASSGNELTAHDALQRKKMMHCSRERQRTKKTRGLIGTRALFRALAALPTLSLLS